MEASRRPHQMALTNVAQEILRLLRECVEVECITVLARGVPERYDFQFVGVGNAVFGVGIFGARYEEGYTFSHGECRL